MVQGVFLGNFMHDFRHEAPSQTNVPIANSDGHINGTVYHIELYDQYGAPVPVTNIASHYGHDIGSPYTAEGVYYADDGKFTLHVGCTDFEGQFLYFSFSHQGEMEANGWYSYVTTSYETLDCPDVVNWESAPSEVSDPSSAESSYGGDSNPYAATNDNSGGNREAKPDKPKRPNRPNRPNRERSDELLSDDEYNQYYFGDDNYTYYDSYDNYNYRK